MDFIQQKKRFYVWVYFIIILFAVGGLVVNIKTIKLNDAIRKKSKQLNILQEENETLELNLIGNNTLEQTEAEAKKRNMMPPKTIQTLYYANQ